MAANINVVVITGNLAENPKLRRGDGDKAICELQVAVNTRHTDGATGESVDELNYFDVTVLGARAKVCAGYLSKGRPIAVEGRLGAQERDELDGSGERKVVKVIAHNVQLIGGWAENNGDPSDVPQKPLDDDMPF